MSGTPAKPSASDAAPIPTAAASEAAVTAREAPPGSGSPAHPGAPIAPLPKPPARPEELGSSAAVAPAIAEELAGTIVEAAPATPPPLPPHYRASARYSACQQLHRDLLVDLVRHGGTLVRELVRPMEGPRLDGLIPEATTLDLARVTTVEQRPDCVTLFRRRSGEPAHVVVTDVQLHIDAERPWLWPVFVTAAHALFSCPASLLVVAPEPHIARWAKSPSKKINLFFEPAVASYRDVPRIEEELLARRVPELAVLSALAHQSPAVVRAAGAALSSLEERRAGRYLQALQQLLPQRLHGELVQA